MIDRSLIADTRAHAARDAGQPQPDLRQQSSDEIRRDMLAAISGYAGPVTADLAARWSERWTEDQFIAQWNKSLGDLITAVRREEAAAKQAELTSLSFIHAVLDLAQRADFRGELIWRSDGAALIVCVDVSDVFAWGGADAEDLTPERLPLLAQAVADLRAIHPNDDMYAVDLFAARLRGMRPQGAAYPKERAATQALFDACGPERPTGLGNPRKPPVPKETP